MTPCRGGKQGLSTLSTGLPSETGGCRGPGGSRDPQPRLCLDVRGGWKGERSVPDGGGGQRWRGTRPWGHRPRRSQPSPGRSRCRTRVRWSRPRHTWSRLCLRGHRAPGLSLRAARQPRAVAAGPGLTWAGCGLRESGRERGSRSSPGHSWPPRAPRSLLSRRVEAATGPQECGPGRPHIWASGPARPRPGGAQRRRSWPRPR